LTYWPEIISASKLLSDSLEVLDEDKDRWFLKLVMMENEDSFSEKISSRREEVGFLVNWPRPGRRKIPSGMISLFVVETLDLDLLSVKEIRRIYLLALEITDAERLILLKDLVKSNNPSVESTEDLIDFEIRMGSSLARSYCRILGVPTLFSSKGTSDSRTPFEVISSVKRLPPLIDFQLRVRELAQNIFSKPNGRAMIVMPTGSGKTRTSIEAAFHFVLRNCNWPVTILWIADRDELCEQAFQSFRQIFIHKCQEINDEERPDSLKMWRYWGGLDNRYKNELINFSDGVYVTSVQQLQSRLRTSDLEVKKIISKASIVIVDEAHRNLDFIEELDARFRNSVNQPKMIGLSATPLRRDRAESSRLHHVFDSEIICPIEGAEYDIDIMIEQLTERNILAKRINIDPYDLIDFDSINQSPGQKQYLQKLVQIIRGIRGMGRKSILVFTKDVEHARILSSALKLDNEPIIAEYIDAATPVEKRKNTINSFREGGVEVLLNYGILTTGFDAPNTDAVIICRTLDQEDSLFKQMVGRGLRGNDFGGTSDCSIVHFEEEY